MKTDISFKSLIDDLENGLTKFKKDDIGLGSIEEKFKMTEKQVTILFRHPLLKDLEISPFPFNLVDDRDGTFNVSAATIADEPAAPVVKTNLMKKPSDEIVFVEAPSAAKELSVTSAKEEPDPVVTAPPAPDAIAKEVKPEVTHVAVPVSKSEDFAEATPVVKAQVVDDEPNHDYMNLL